MELVKKTQLCNSLNEIPDFKTIKSIPSGIEMKIVFADKIKSKRKKIGNQWKFEHPEFQIAIHTIESEINIVKLITDQEIEKHQYFFETCAKDYRNLATKLINEFANKHKIKIDEKYPMNTLCHTDKFGYKPIGEMNDWRYAFHGIHCAFTNLKTGQRIEVPLNYGLEFGQLDPYFFIGFIQSSKEYQPLPIQMHCNYADGQKILNKMVQLERFEYINSNWPYEKGIVVTDRKKIKVHIIEDIEVTDKSINNTGVWNKIKSLFN